jgi:hypothetical protein
VAERFAVYRYDIRRDGVVTETRWSFAPVKPAGYAGNDEPSEAHPMAEGGGDAGEMQPAGHVEAPDGSRITSFEPPILEIPGRGSVDLLAVIGVGEGEAGALAEAVRYRPG